MVLKVCTCTPLNLLGECSLPMACAVTLPEGYLKITWSATGLKVYDSPLKMLSGDLTTAVLGYQNYCLLRGEEGKRLEKSRKYSDFEGTHQATEKQCTNSQVVACLILKPVVIRYLNNSWDSIANLIKSGFVIQHYVPGHQEMWVQRPYSSKYFGQLRSRNTRGNVREVKDSHSTTAHSSWHQGFKNTDPILNLHTKEMEMETKF